MAQNTRFAMSVQALCLLAEGDVTTHTSQDIAESMNTNPVVVRRVLSALQRAGLIESSKGPSGGSRLALPAKQITLADIYRATETDSLFHMPLKTPASSRALTGALTSVFRKAEDSLKEELGQVSLSALVKKSKKAKK